MEPLENISGAEFEYDVVMNELSEETPVGWSSTCLDQTINYYIDWNSTHFNGSRYIENFSSDK